LGLGFEVSGQGFRVKGLRFRNAANLIVVLIDLVRGPRQPLDAPCDLQSSGFRVCGLAFRVYGFWFRV
jgi:hypothetical protein